jgi:phage shock protein PspC (stress-responsive transcriptional regulator)
MKTAISVDLGGASYSLDQDAFLTLHAYLDRAAERLGEHPDRDEVLAGLERSIGAKLARGGERSAPVGAAEMTASLREVGKVDGPRLGPERADARPAFEGEPSGEHPDFGRDRADDVHSSFAPDSNTYPDSYSYGVRPRRLYRLNDGKKIAGVCAGLAAYADLDVGLVRVIAVIAAFFTGGFVILAVYVALMFLVPLARTSTEIAAAHGALRSA